ncbi:MAG: hypothetical protein AAFP90_00155, partial [Planctomycetota bacterium]
LMDVGGHSPRRCRGTQPAIIEDVGGHSPQSSEDVGGHSPQSLTANFLATRRVAHGRQFMAFSSYR